MATISKDENYVCPLHGPAFTAALDARFAEMEVKNLQARQPPWHTVWTAFGVLVAFSVLSYRLVVEPLDNRLTKIESNLTELSTQVVRDNEGLQHMTRRLEALADSLEKRR